MRHKRIPFLIFLALTFIRVSPLQADPCWKTIFEWNESRSNSSQERILILPFQNATEIEADNWLSYLFPLMLQDYLSLSKKIQPVVALNIPNEGLFEPEKAILWGEQSKSAYLIQGQFQREGTILKVSSRLYDIGKKMEIKRINGQVEFPGTRTMNDFLIELTEQASKGIKKLKINRKQIAPYKNETASSEALHFFTLGTLALKTGTDQGAYEAVRRFEEAVRQDYNYVPAYLGLSLALARQGFLYNSKEVPYRDSFARARLELEKARLLNQTQTKRKESVIEPYLKAETQYRLAEGFAAQGNFSKAIVEIEKAIRWLPGDLESRRRLVDYLEKTGKTKGAKEQKEMIEKLDACGEN